MRFLNFMKDISVCSPLNSLPELLCLFLYCCSLWLSCKHTIIYALELKIKFREQHENVVTVFFIHCFSLFLLFFVLSWLFLVINTFFPFLFKFFFSRFSKLFPFFRYQKLNKSRVQYIQCKNALSPVLKLFFIQLQVVHIFCEIENDSDKIVTFPPAPKGTIL